MPPVRLQKYFTDCGVMSRRAAEEQIRLGKVRVNGRIAEIGDTVEPYVDTVEFGGKLIVPRNDEKICIMLNKPRGYVTTMNDDRGRKNVTLLTADIKERLYPIGRLDMDSEGLLLMTNDGELANILTHPRHEIPKIYRVSVRGKVSDTQLSALGSAMVIDGYKILPVKTVVISPAASDTENTVLEMTLFEGRNRQIRKMCESQKLSVRRLQRQAYGSIKLASLPVGKWRRLTRAEIDYLKGTAKNTDERNSK